MVPRHYVLHIGTSHLVKRSAFCTLFAVDYLHEAVYTRIDVQLVAPLGLPDDFLQLGVIVQRDGNGSCQQRGVLLLCELVLAEGADVRVGERVELPFLLLVAELQVTHLAAIWLRVGDSPALGSVQSFGGVGSLDLH